MSLRLESKHALSLQRALEMHTRVGGVRHNLLGAKAASLPLGRVLTFDPETPLREGIGDLKKKRQQLKERIIEIHGYRDFKPEDVMFTSGTYESNLLVLSQAVEPGDEIVMMRPCWHQFAGYKMAEKNYSFCCGGLNPNSKVHLLTRKEEEDWSYDVDGLKEVASSKTGLIVVNSPDNPTGNITPPSELRAICEIAEDYGAYVLHDEIYRGTEWDEMFSSPQAVNYYDKAVATNSFSKLHGWDALRLGWLATKDKKLFSRCLAVNGWLLNGMGAISPLQLEVGLAGLERNKFNEHVAHGRSLGRACWDEMERWMSKLKGVFNWKRPMAGFLSFPSYNLEIDSWSFCERLAQEPYSTGIAPGMGYGFEKHLRLGIGTANPEVVKGGMEQVERFVSTLKPISDPITVRR